MAETEMKSRERCVLCGEETEYFKDTPVFRRKYYIDGVGQLCLICFMNIRREQEDEANKWNRN